MIQSVITFISLLYRNKPVIILVSVICLFACKKQQVFSESKTEVVLNSSDKRFTSSFIKLAWDTVYRITSNIEIKDGQTFKIEAGTLLKINNNVKISVQPGALIEAKGTAELPIVFTSSTFKGGQGAVNGGGSNNWGGLEIYGTNHKSSGELKYIRIEFAGSSEGKAGLFLENVDSSTLLEYIQVSYTYATPSFSFSGANCAAKYLVSLGGAVSDFELKEGYKGKLQNILSYRLPLIPYKSPGYNLAGILISQSGTHPVISNATVIGPDNQKGTSAFYLDTSDFFTTYRKAGIVVFNNASFHLRNSVVLGFPAGGVYIDGTGTALSLAGGQSELAFSFIHCNNNSRIFYLPRNLFPGLGPEQLKDFFLQSQFSNKVFLSSDDFQLTNPFHAETPELLPKAGSLLLTTADFNGPVFNHLFFNKVNYSGAFGSEDWMKGWTNFTPLQTNYNN